MVSWGVNFSIWSNITRGSVPLPQADFFWIVPWWPHPFAAWAHLITSKSPPSPNLYALPSPTNMTTMIRQHKSSPLLQDLPGKADHQAIHCPTANFGPLSRGSVTNSMLITVFDTYLTPRSPGASVWGNTLQILNSSTLTYISMSRLPNNISITQFRVNERKTNLTRPLKRLNH